MAFLIPLLGMVVLLVVAILLSSNFRQINFRTIGFAFLLQAGIAAVVLYSEAGVQALNAIVSGAQKFIDYANAGIGFVFGSLGSADNIGFVFALHVLPVIIFISALMAALYYLGIMQRVIGMLGGALQKLLGTSRVESTCAAANIFIAQSDTPMLIKPFIPKMTQSELFAIMTGGMASVAGSVMLGYAVMGVELKYLIAASFMAAPGGLLMAKMLLPETETPENNTQLNYDDGDPPANLIDALASGAMNGGRVAISVGAMLIAFIAVIALVNGMLSGLGGLVGIESLTLEGILGWIFSPLAFLLGVPWSEAQVVAALIGKKIVLNEFVAYVSLTDPETVLSEHSRAVVTFALCGFANISSIAIQLGGIGVVAPSRRADVARLGFKAVAAASLANMMSAALASFFLLIS